MRKKDISLRKLVGENVRKFRLKRGFTQEKLAVRADLTNEYISRLEHGLENISIDSLSRIGKALGVEPYLFLVPPKQKKGR